MSNDPKRTFMMGKGVLDHILRRRWCNLSMDVSALVKLSHGHLQQTVSNGRLSSCGLAKLRRQFGQSRQIGRTSLITFYDSV